MFGSWFTVAVSGSDQVLDWNRARGSDAVVQFCQRHERTERPGVVEARGGEGSRDRGPFRAEHEGRN